MRPICALIVFAATGRAWAQVEVPPARAPCSVLSGHPCHPAFCGVFHRGPCIPEILGPLGENLQLTIVSTDDNDPAAKPSDDADKPSGDHTLDTIREMFAALRACWVPPPKDEARHGMEYTVRFALKRDGAMIAPPRVTYASHDAPAEVREVYRDAVDAALARCMPLHFGDGMAGAIAGRPIAIRFVDNRTIDAGKTLQSQRTSLRTSLKLIERLAGRRAGSACDWKRAFVL